MAINWKYHLLCSLLNSKQYAHPCASSCFGSIDPLNERGQSGTGEIACTINLFQDFHNSSFKENPQCSNTILATLGCDQILELDKRPITFFSLR